MAPLKAPRHRNFGGFVHMLARHFQNYRAAVLRAARRKRNRSVDIDVQVSANGTAWCFHWPTVGKNKYHDPSGHIKPSRRIDSLTDAQIRTLRGPHGERPHTLRAILILAAKHDVRVEAEVKVAISKAEWLRLLGNKRIRAMNERGDLQVKTLAFMGAPLGPVNRLRPAHEAGIDTILSFTGFRKRGISKTAAWPVTTFVRGRAKWTA